MLYFGTGWDLYEVMRDQMELLALQKHEDARFNQIDDFKAVDFVVIKEVPLSDSFQLSAFEEKLDQQLRIERSSYRSLYAERLVEIYQLSRLR